MDTDDDDLRFEGPNWFSIAAIGIVVGSVLVSVPMLCVLGLFAGAVPLFGGTVALLPAIAGVYWERYAADPNPALASTALALSIVLTAAGAVTCLGLGLLVGLFLSTAYGAAG
jgi:hypothetical protein